MRTHSFVIHSDKHQSFLAQERIDPITGDAFEVGQQVVFCAVCKSAFLKDSWEYMNRTHCEQRRTLPSFPVSRALILEKPIPMPYLEVDNGTRFSAYLVDILICLVLSIIFATVLKELDIVRGKPYLVALIAAILLTFRDNLLINRSIRKKFNRLYFVDTATNEPARGIYVFGRNVLFWIMNGLLILLIWACNAYLFSDELIKASNKRFESLYSLLTLSLLILNGFYLVYHLQNKYTWFDKLLGIRLVRQKHQPNG